MNFWVLVDKDGNCSTPYWFKTLFQAEDFANLRAKVYSHLERLIPIRRTTWDRHPPRVANRDGVMIQLLPYHG